MVFWDWSQFLTASGNREIRRRWCTRIVRTHGCGMWKNIRAGAKNLETLSGCIVCGGSRSSYSVLVQSLEWAPSSKGSLSRPFCLLCSKNAWISDLIISSLEGGGRGWSIHFYRAFHNCVLEEVYTFFEFLYSKCQAVRVIIIWLDSCHGMVFLMCTFIITLCLVLLLLLSLGRTFGV